MFDFHMHSNVSFDAKGSARGMAEKAALLGLKETGPFAAVYEEGTPVIYQNDHSAINWKQNVKYSLHSEEKSG